MKWSLNRKRITDNISSSLNPTDEALWMTNLCFVWTAVLTSPGGCCHHVPEQHVSPGRGGAVESGNLPPGAQVCPAKTHHIPSDITHVVILVSLLAWISQSLCLFFFFGQDAYKQWILMLGSQTQHSGPLQGLNERCITNKYVSEKAAEVGCGV